MAMQDCINVIKAAAGEGKINDKQAEQLLSDLDDFIQLKKKSLQVDNLDATIAQHLQKKLDDSILSAAIEKRNAVINARVLAKAFNRVEAFGNAAEGLSALLVGSVKSKYGSKLSIDAEGKALGNKYLGRLINDLEKSGNLELFVSGKLDNDIAREMWEIKPNGTPGITNNTPAREIAAILHKYQTTAVERLNRAGAYINPRPGYIFRQGHDQTRIRDAGYEKWRDFIYEKLDHEATFGDANPEEFLRGAYNGLTTGYHKRFKGESESNHLNGFTGPANLAKKASQERLLHFKDADSFMAYNTQFGTQNLRDGIINGLEHMARNTALMEGLGTNPVANFDKLLGQLRNKYQTDPKMMDKLSDKSIMNQLKEIDGTTRIAGNVSMARIGAMTRAIQNMAKLGGAVISSITDLPAQAAELRYQGMPLLNSYAQVIGNLFQGRGPAERRQLARLLGVGFDSMIGDIHSRFGSQDSLPGTAAKLQQRFFKLNGMAWWDDTNRIGTALIMSANLAENATKSFDKLDGKLQNVLQQYGITKGEWELYRNYGVSKHTDGELYVTSDGLEQLSEADIAAYLRNKGEKPSKPLVSKEEQAKALDSYGESSEPINNFLRGEGPGGKQTESVVKALDDALRMGETLKEDITVYRMVPTNAYADAKNVEKGFMSVTRNKDEALAFAKENGLEPPDGKLVEIKVPKGTPFVKMGSIIDANYPGYKYTSELLLPRGAELTGAGDVKTFRHTGKSEYAPRVIQETKDELITRLDAYFQDRSDHAVPKPGAAERAIMNQGTSAGTIEGEALRLIMQFKSFPIAMIRRSLGREVYGTADGKSDIGALVHVMVATTLFGYMSMVAKDILKGREPRTFTGEPEQDIKLMFAAMSQGGGLGIYGDFLFGEYSRYGRSFLSTLAGPTLGQVDDIAEIMTRIRTGEDVGANVLRTVINNTPFINLFYTRQALDYLFLYELQEMVNPGYTRRMESRIMRENNQQFFVPPSQAVPYGGSLRSLVQ